MINDLKIATSVLDASNQPTPRAELEKRLLDINAQVAALTPNAFQMPQTLAAKTSQRLKKQELVQPDAEVLRQLLLEKADIAERLAAMPQGSRGLQMPRSEFSVKAEKTKLG